MAAPHTQCMITKVMGADAQGRPVFGEERKESCSIIKFLGDGTDVSMGNGNAPEAPISQKRIADAVLLLPITTTAGLNDMIEVAGVKLKVIGISPSYDVVGKLDHYIVEALLWK
jgi:hypothetical protein